MMERAQEHLITENSLLRNEIEHWRIENKFLLDKIFEITGVTPRVKPVEVPITSTPVRVAGPLSWAQGRQRLEENAAKEAYWNKKKEENEKLEKEVTGDASKNS